MAQRVRVAVVDDNPVFRLGVVEALREWSEFEVVGEAENAADAVELVRRESPEIVLLDLGIPGGGQAAAAIVLASRPGTRIVVLTAYEDEDYVRAALKSGVRGYVLKGVGARELVRILEEVMAGRIYVSPSLAN